ncbi:MAG: PAS domain S-box protein [Crocinitomicaceae bacterium]
MLKKISTSLKLAGLIFFLFTLFLGLSLYNKYEINTIKRNSDKMYQDVIDPIIQLSTVRYNFGRGIRTNVKQLMYIDSSFTQSIRQIQRSKEEVKINWAEYLKTKRSGEEAILNDELDQLIKEAVIKTDNLMVILSKEDKQAMQQFALREVYLSVENAVDHLTYLIEHFNQNGKTLRVKNEELSQRSKFWFEMILLIFLVVAIVLSYFIADDIRKLVDSLRASNKKIQESEMKYRSVFENAGDGLFVLGEDKLIKAVNKKGAELTGYSNEELIGMKPETLHSIEDAIANPFDWSILLSGASVINQRKMLRKDGSIVDVEMNTSILGHRELLSVVRDTSERLKSEKAQKVSEEKFAIAVMSSADAICITTFPAGVFTEINKSFSELTGYEKEEIIGKPRENFNFYKDSSKRSQVLKQILEKGFVENQEIIFKKRNGEEMLTLMTSHLFYIDEEPFVYSTIKDITKEYEDHQELLRIETRITELVESTEAVIWESNAHTFTVKYVSSNAEHLYGYTEEEWYQDDFWLNHVYEEDRETSVQFMQELKANPRSYTSECRFLTKDGRIVWMKMVANLLYENGEPRWYRGINLDITEQKRRETDLIELTTRLQLATKSAHLGIFDLDLINMKLIWDEYSYQIFGITPDDTANTYRAFAYSIHPEDRLELRHYHNSVVENGGEYFVIFRIVWPNSEVRYIETNGVILRDSKGKAYQMIGVNRDITEITLAQEQLLNANELLEQKVWNRTMDLQTANTKINDSINYAQKIQLALLSKPEDCAVIFPKSFVLWSPKDVVSGDLFWCHSDERYNYIAAIDCTGHGVPGALLSIVAKQTLDTIVISKGIIEPKDILFQLDEVIVNALHHHSKLVKDGMDIVFCRIEKATNSIEFAGAQLPLLYHDGESLLEISGTNLGIGGFLRQNQVKSFEQTQIQGKAGDLLYLTSDGYYAQFGGENGKKLMKRNFSSLLESVASKPIQEQKVLLYNHLKNWQGSEEQVDDILVVGIEL